MFDFEWPWKKPGKPKVSWWILRFHSNTPVFVEGIRCSGPDGQPSERKEWFFKEAHSVCEEGRSCFHTQKEAQEQVIKNLKVSIASLQEELAEAEASLKAM